MSLLDYLMKMIPNTIGLLSGVMSVLTLRRLRSVHEEGIQRTEVIIINIFQICQHNYPIQFIKDQKIKYARVLTLSSIVSLSTHPIRFPLSL